MANERRASNGHPDRGGETPTDGAFTMQTSMVATTGPIVPFSQAESLHLLEQ